MRDTVNRSGLPGSLIGAVDPFFVIVAPSPFFLFWFQAIETQSTERGGSLLLASSMLVWGTVAGPPGSHKNTHLYGALWMDFRHVGKRLTSLANTRSDFQTLYGLPSSNCFTLCFHKFPPVSCLPALGIHLPVSLIRSIKQSVLGSSPTFGMPHFIVH
ncbi:hypothetical protein EV421DRAFT_803210 [Armillaria borealis]|uniref:Uncharacterized protein n=1 Tax=Armillaria borealis TaxID=47425 RepID=A0AA39MN60_9AGAR|nr:hypothetical protein EV421DRAFT_803210 [Armillaria borealis]